MKKFKESAFWKSPAKVSIILFVVLEIITFYLQPNVLTMSWISLKAESAITLLFAAVGGSAAQPCGKIPVPALSERKSDALRCAVSAQGNTISYFFLNRK